MIHFIAIFAVSLLASAPAYCQTGAAPQGKMPVVDQAGPTDLHGDPLPHGAIARLGTARLRHIVRDGSGAACVAFSPDGKTLLSGGDVGLSFWDVATGKRLAWLGQKAAVVAAHFARDGKSVFTADNEGIIRHWAADSGAMLSERKPARDFPFHGHGAFFSANGQLLGLCGISGEVQIFRVADGTCILHWKEKYRPFSYYAAAVSPNGKTLVVGGEANRAHLVDVATGGKLREYRGPNLAPSMRPGNERIMYEAVNCFAFSPDAAIVVALGKDLLVAWDAQTGKLRYCVPASGGRLAFSPDGKRLACFADGAIRLLDAADGKEVRRFAQPISSPRALAFGPDGKLLAAAHDYFISLWDVTSGRRLHAFPGHGSPIASLAFSPDGAGLASGDSEEGKLIVWDLTSGKPRHEFSGHYPNVLSIAYSPNGKLIASGDGYDRGMVGGLDAQIRLWSASEGKLVRQWPGHLNSVQSLAFSPDGRVLLSAGHDARARLWEVASGQRLWQIRGNDSRLKTVAFAPDGKTILVAGDPGELALWQVETARKALDLTPDARGIYAAPSGAFSADGKSVLALAYGGGGGSSNWIRSWDRSSGQMLRSFPITGANLQYDGFALSPNGKLVAVGSGNYRDPTIHIWNTESGQQVGRLVGHAGGFVPALAFSPDNKILASGGRDTTILLWDVADARLEYLWKFANANSIKALAATPDTVIPFLKKRLRPALALEIRVAHLVAGLNSDEFRVRAKASVDLEKLGPDAAFALQAALAKPATLEVRRRIGVILEKVNKIGEASSVFDPSRSRFSLAVLEEIDSTEARQVLEELAQGPVESTVGREARATLNRLAQRRKKP